MNKKVVIALGGNALGDTNEEQKEAVSKAVNHIVDLIAEGHQVVVVHGNGPQVGKIQLAFETAQKHDQNIESMPLSESVAMSQGYIGYHLQNALISQLEHKKIDKSVATILTHSLVDINDDSFNHPTKPIGPFYTLDQIKEMKIEHYVEDSGRGYRQVVASPMPIDLLEKKVINHCVDNGDIIICAGGGGIPLGKENDEYINVNAVIDKDASASLLAQLIDADLLIILTAVKQIALNYNTPDEIWLSEVSVSQLDQYIEENHFAPGSMLPKVEASKRFILNNPNSKAIITSLESAKDAINGLAGTVITNG